MSMMKEFREFAMKGNVVDLAVGVIIGAAFGKIVSSMVEDIVMPPIGLLLGKADFSDVVITLREADELTKTAASVMRVGVFLNTVINFLIVAFCIFLIVRQMNRLRRTEPKP